MAFMTVKLVPGVHAEQTPLLLQAGVVQSNNVRWKDGLPEKIGGWKKFYPDPIPGPVRELWTWEDLSVVTHLAVAGDGGVVVITGPPGPTADYQPIDPQFATRHPAGMSTTASSPIVVITDIGSNASPYEAITLETPYSVGGICIYPGNYKIVSVADVDHYSIDVGKNAVTTAGPGTSCTITSTVGSASFAVHLLTHGKAKGDSFAIVLPTAVGGVSLYGFFTVATFVDANNFTILGPNQAVTAQTVFYGNFAIQLLQWIVGNPAAPPTLNALAAFTTNYGAIYMPPNPGFVVPGMTVVDQTTGIVLGTVQSYGRQIRTASQTGYNIGDTTIGMFNEGWRFALPGMQVKFSSTLVGTVASYIGKTLVLTAGALYPGVPGGPLDFVSPTQDVLFISPPGPVLGPLPANSAGANDTLAFVVGGSGSGVPVTGGQPLTPVDWCMFNFGSILLVNPEDGPIFQYDPTAGLGNAQIIVNAPPLVHGMFLAMPQQMVVAYGASVQGVQDPMLVAWSDAGNFNTWTLAVNNQAGTYRLSRGSKIIGGIQAPMQAMLWTDVGLWLMTYIGYPDVWGFSEVAQECGLIAKKAVGVIGGQVFWMGQDRFWTFTGGQAQPLPCEVWDAVFQNLNRDLVDRIRCGTDTGFDGIGWFFPSLATRQAGAVQENDSYVKLNRVTGEWDYGTPVDVFGDGNTGGAMVSDWIDANVYGNPISAMTLVPSLESQLMWMDMGQDADDQPLHWWIRTGLFILSEGEEFIFIDRCRPDFKWRKFSDPTTPSAEVKITLYAQDDSDNPNNPPKVFGPFTVTDTTGSFDPRARGRYFSLKVEGDDLGSFVRLGAVKFRFSPDGRAG